MAYTLTHYGEAMTQRMSSHEWIRFLENLPHMTLQEYKMKELLTGEKARNLYFVSEDTDLSTNEVLRTQMFGGVLYVIPTAPHIPQHNDTSCVITDKFSNIEELEERVGAKYAKDTMVAMAEMIGKEFGHLGVEAVKRVERGH